YSNRDRVSAHIETMLKNIKLRNPLIFQNILDNINQFWGNKKQITDFDENLRLLVRVDKPKPVFHYIEDLSSGEQQCLIMMVMVSRWMMPGGVVLIDEPDLHLHTKLQNKILEEMYDLIPENSQLIISTHSIGMMRKAVEMQKIYPD
ncbi:MAG TPA: AAA family ATPase, partial [Aggregatilineales bacterium]|nr:AAA family ATPase [Aggregatilineales bacterium]